MNLQIEHVYLFMCIFVFMFVLLLLSSVQLYIVSICVLLHKVWAAIVRIWVCVGVGVCVGNKVNFLLVSIMLNQP